MKAVVVAGCFLPCTLLLSVENFLKIIRIDIYNLKNYNKKKILFSPKSRFWAIFLTGAKSKI
jgi:hypothetical protein